MGDVLEQVSAVSEQMVLCGLNKEELLLLQATVLVNAGEDGFIFAVLDTLIINIHTCSSVLRQIFRRWEC